MVSTYEHNRAALSKRLATAQQNFSPNLPSPMGYNRDNLDLHYLNAYNSFPTNFTPQNALPAHNNFATSSWPTHFQQMQNGFTNFPPCGDPRPSSTMTTPATNYATQIPTARQSEQLYFKPHDRPKATVCYMPDIRSDVTKGNSFLLALKPIIIKTFNNGDTEKNPSQIISTAHDSFQKTTNPSDKNNPANVHNLPKATKTSDKKDLDHAHNSLEKDKGAKKTKRQRKTAQKNTQFKNSQTKRKRLNPINSQVSQKPSNKVQDKMFGMFNLPSGQHSNFRTSWGYPNSELTAPNGYLYQRFSADQPQPPYLTSMKLPIILPKENPSINESNPQPVQGNHDLCQLNATVKQTQGSFQQENNERLRALLRNGGSNRNILSGTPIPSRHCNISTGHINIDARPEQQPDSMESSLALTPSVTRNNSINVSGNNTAVDTKATNSITNNYSLQCSNENQYKSAGFEVLDDFEYILNEVCLDTFCTLPTPPVTPDNDTSIAPPTLPVSSATMTSSAIIESFATPALSSLSSAWYESSTPPAVSKPHTSSTPSAVSKPHTSSTPSAVSNLNTSLSSTPSAVSKPHASSTPSAVSKPHASSTPSAVSKSHTSSTPSAVSKPHTSSTPSAVSKPHTSSTPSAVSKPDTSSTPSAVSKPHTSSTPSAVSKLHSPSMAYVICAPVDKSNEAGLLIENLAPMKSLKRNKNRDTDNTAKQKISRAKMFTCHICPYQIEKLFNFQLHMAQHYNNRDKLIPVNVSRHKLRCGICGYFGTDENDLEAHVGEHVLQKRFVCRYCDLDFERKDEVRSHITSSHGELLVFYDRHKIYKQMVRQAQMVIPIHPVVVLDRDEADQYVA